MKTPLVLTPGLFAAVALHATVILDFSGNPGTTNTKIGATFASAVPNSGGVAGATVIAGAGAPDITLGWTASGTSEWQFYNSWSTLGAVAQLDLATVGATFDLTFTPSNGAAVTIGSFDLAIFSGFSQDVVWSVFAVGSPGSVLASGDSGLVAGGALATQNIGFSGDPGTAYTLRLSRIAGGSNVSNALAVDNIVYGQVAVPEPGVTGLFAAGCAGVTGLIRMRRRHRSA